MASVMEMKRRGEELAEKAIASSVRPVMTLTEAEVDRMIEQADEATLDALEVKIVAERLRRQG